MMAYSRILRKGLKLLCPLLALMALILLIAHFSLQNPAEAAAFKSWMTNHRYVWLTWRLALYVGTGWGAWKIWHAPGFREEYRLALLRMLAVSGALILVCEYVLLRGGQ
jgi:hypothetical protein